MGEPGSWARRLALHVEPQVSKASKNSAFKPDEVEKCIYLSRDVDRTYFILTVSYFKT